MRLREAVGRVLLVALGAGLAVLGAEGMVRAYTCLGTDVGERLARRDPMAVLFEPHGSFGYRQRPNWAQSYRNGTRANWNSMGYRGPLVQRVKPPGTFRIILLGGSATHGLGVNDDQTIDAHMRALLPQRFPGIRFEVVNLALGGYDSYQVFERMRSDGVALSPDLVIVNSGINDVSNARFSDLKIPDSRALLWEHTMSRLRERARRDGPSAWTRIRHYSYLARLPGFLVENWAQREAVRINRGIRPKPDALDYFESNLLRTADLVERSGAALILSKPPSSLATKYAPEDTSSTHYWVVDASTTEDYRRQLALRMQRIAATRTVSGRPVGYVEHDLPPELFLDDCHLTGAGNRAVAANFVEALAPFVRELSARKPRLAPES